ncbi:MAG: hypothetical protein GXO62_05555 [Epsilonproteobacteria bacterium]|nr:hypothetical protein [Campylobacterota bacterium]
MRERFKLKLEELEKHLKQLKRNFKYLDAFYGFPLKNEYVETILESGDIDKLDSIAYRLIKFQDSLGRTFKLFFSMYEENTDSLLMLDLINLAEKKGFSIDINFWRELRELRNEITHEYVENIDEITYALNRIYELIEKMETILNELKNRSDF